MKIMKSMLTGLALLSVVSLSMSGCTSLPSTGDGGSEQVKSLAFMESPNPVMSFEDGDNSPIQRTEDNWRELSTGSVEINLHGSSSCPPSVEKITQKSSTITVELKPLETFMACTEDLRNFYVTVAGTDDVEKVELISNKDGKVSELPKSAQLSSTPQALSDVPIMADPSAKLTNANVEVRTIAAPKSEPVSEPVTPAPVTQTPTQKNTVPVAPAPAQKNTVPVAPAPKVAAPAPVRPAPVAPPAAPAPTGNAWIQATMAKYGVYAPAGTKFIIGPVPASCAGADGCTEYSHYADGIPFDITITIRPGQLTEYLLFHEIGHARGIDNECAADNFARSVLGPVQGHYC